MEKERKQCDRIKLVETNKIKKSYSSAALAREEFYSYSNYDLITVAINKKMIHYYRKTKSDTQGFTECDELVMNELSLIYRNAQSEDLFWINKEYSCTNNPWEPGYHVLSQEEEMALARREVTEVLTAEEFWDKYC